MALALHRKQGERVRLTWGGVEVWIAVARIDGDRACLAVTAPPEVVIEREEIIGRGGRSTPEGGPSCD
jgi:sRNA-binding carbon storage regulator CsrA